MTKLVAGLDGIRSRLEALVAQHRVPGASLAVLDGDQIIDVATGVANVRTGVEVDTDTLFQIGSNTKLYTATLIMQLVDAGRVDLDSPVRSYIDDFAVADKDASKQITVRQLLAHSSGMQGDYFEDFGPGDDCIARYVESLSTITQVHPPGDRFSYCNTGFTVAGHIVERVTTRPFHEVLKESLLTPLGLRSTTVLLEEMVGFRYAAGHAGGEAGTPQVVPEIIMSRSSAPAGSRTSATARDVLGFVRMHLDDGQAADGTRVLSDRSVTAMQRPQLAMPGSPSPNAHIGLGWIMAEWDGQRVIGHGGGTYGQLSFLQVLPDRRFAVCLLTNSTTGTGLWRDLGGWLFDELAGVTMPEVPRPPDPPPILDLAHYAGRFERLSQRFDLEVEDEELVMSVTLTGPLADNVDAPSQRLHLRPIDAERFVVKMPTGDAMVAFSDFDAKGRPGYLFIGRAAPRVARVPTKRKKAVTTKTTKKTRSR
ncbi:MAG: beta-lactamase family protein [Actinobacteria bacterium]|nr:beta-lactamase family protein [Actinomycetota bacterium]